MPGEPRKAGKFELVPGDTLGKYEILRKLAVGGMAELYLARIRGNAGFEKVVVLKRILPQVAEDATFVQMFLEEARLAGTLNHPNVAHVYDVGEVDGEPFFTMEFVHGQDVRSIRHELKKVSETVPLGVALAVVHGTAAALNYAHERTGPDGKLLGLVHRDVSASNVMVSYDGAVKLLDFGIARAASSTHKTQVGTLKGKVPYMSPEQCKGQPLDRRSDLFSLGVVMFELTVGRRPFRGDSDFAIMDQIVYKGAPAPSSIVTDYPPELEAIVMKLLERDPKARYTTGEELIEDLDAFVQSAGLWMSATKIGKWMRGVFAEKIRAWEEAEQQGVSFAQHVAHSITSQSQRSELVTPPSAFPGLPQADTPAPETVPEGKRRTSAAMNAVAAPKRTSQPMAAVAPPRRTSQPMAAVAPPRRTSQSMPAVAPPTLPATVEPPPTEAQWDAPTTSDDPQWDAPTTRATNSQEDEVPRPAAATHRPTPQPAHRPTPQPPHRPTPQPPQRPTPQPPRRPTPQPIAEAPRRPTPRPMPLAVEPDGPSSETTVDRTSESTMERPSEPTVSGPMMPLVAPPSAPVAVPRFVTPAMPMPTPAAPFAPMGAAPIVPMDLSGSAPVADLRPRSSRAIVFAFVAALVIGGGVGGYALMSKSSQAPAASVGSEVQTTSTPIVVPPPPAPVKPVETQPEPVKPAVEAKPAVETKPVVETKPAAPVVEKPKPVVVEKPKPVVVEKPKPAVQQQPVVKKPVKPKEQSWDPNSPFLPGQ